MRAYVKKQLIKLLDSMGELQSSLSMMTDKGQTIQMLADCQDAAVAIGETLERDSLDHESIIFLLEEYCEEVFYLSEYQEETICREKVTVLEKLTDKVKILLEELSSVWHVIFMPYKASMWDSLENIWRACKEDKRCECYVMPIPYYEFDSKTNRWTYCYDGDLFPEEVPITHYQNYSIQQNCPEVAYVHNPYDDLNLVTRVEPKFYSKELKQYVNKLVYVPYYVTSGFIAPEHLTLSVYRNMDYMVVQSEFAKSFCKGMPYYDKILPFGSPKLDRVIRLCQEEPVIPETWKPLLEGKTVLMLNTSIGCFLEQGDIYLQKIKNICKTVNNQNQVALIWRPHPLLEATIKSMRPYLLSDFYELKDSFFENKIGILDETSDISRAIAISDGYIGEEGSSVINMFGAAGKPIFILDNCITNAYAKEERCRIQIADMIKQENIIWVATDSYNALFYMDIITKQVHYAGRVDEQPKWYGAYPFFSKVRNKLYLSPSIARRPAEYDIDSKEFTLIGEEDMMESAMRSISVSFGNRIFYLPVIDDYIAEFNAETGEWRYHTECIQKLREAGIESTIREEMTFRAAVCGEDMWITATYTNCILRFNMENGTYSVCRVGRNENGYSGIVAEERYIWLTEVKSGDIVRWDRRSGKVKSFTMPEEFLSWQSTLGRSLAHIILIDMGQWLVTVPGFSNCMVKLDKASGQTTLFIKDFWKDSQVKVNGYNPQVSLSSGHGDKLDENTIIVQRHSDDAVAIIQVENETYEMFYPTMSENDYEKLTHGEDGFEKRDEKSGFFRRESKIFSFEGFLDDMVHDRLKDVQKRQLKELSTLAANLDGTCGIKVHEYMMNVLENKE